MTANTHADEKLLPLAAELQNVPAIEGGTGVAGVDSDATRNLQAVVAEFAVRERQALLQMLPRPQAG